MKKLGYVEVGWHGLLAALAKFVESWQPAARLGELEYRDELFRLIRSAIPQEARLETEYRNKGTTTDIWMRWKGFFVDGEVSIELKVNLTKKPEFDRLVGQIEALEPKSTNILVVMIGHCDSAFVGRLKEKYCPPSYTYNETETFRVVSIPFCQSRK